MICSWALVSCYWAFFILVTISTCIWWLTLVFTIFLVPSALVILTLAFERYIVVAAPLQSKDYPIYSHLKLAIVYIWLIAACVALLSLLNKCHEAEYRRIVSNAIGIPTIVFMIVIYLRIFYLVRRYIRRDLEESIGIEQQSLL